MKEKDFQTKFIHFAKHYVDYNGAFELKICKEKSLPYSAVKEHQINALKIAKSGLMIYKIPDDSIGQKPFDCFTLKNARAYVVIMFYKPRQKRFYMIDVDDFIKNRDSSNRKSITEDECDLIGISLLLKE